MIYELIKRNIRIYLRNRSSVFFSFLSMLIVIILMLAFLGDMNVNNIISLFDEYHVAGDRVLQKELAVIYIMIWTLAGILIVNAVTVTLSLCGIMVQDEENNILSSFYVAPVRRRNFVLGYILAAIIVSFIFSLIPLIVSQVYLYMNGWDIMDIYAWGKTLFTMLLTIFTCSSIVFFVATYVHTSNAFGSVNTILSTLIGFISAIYLPLGMLPAFIQKVLLSLPFLHSTSILRDTLGAPIHKALFEGAPELLVKEFDKVMGVSLYWNDTFINDTMRLLIITGFGLVFLFLSFIILKKRYRSE